MKKRDRTILLVSLVVLDALALALALLLAFHLRYGATSPGKFEDYMRMIFLAMPIFTVICAYSGLYDTHVLLGGIQEYINVIKASTFLVVALTVLSFWERGGLLSRAWLLMAWVLTIAVMGATRFVFRRVVLWLRRRDLFVSRAIIVGANEQAKEIAHQIQASRGRGVCVVGFLDDYLAPGTPVLDDLKVLGSPNELERLSSETGCAMAVVIPQALAWESFQQLMGKAASQLNGLEVKLSPGFYEILTTGVKVDHTALVPLLTVERVRITGLDALLRNALDFGLGLVLLVVLSPLMAVISLILWRDQTRPVIDRIPVSGLGGRGFLTLKFRTGVRGDTRRSFAYPLPEELADSTRATRFGSFLYRTGLDKLPQIFNVLQGQMSLVGPRTISETSHSLYGPWLPSMLTVKPGMTGPWAVSSVPTFDDEIRLTMYYIRNWTIWLDLQILIQTAGRILRLSGLRGKRKAMEETEASPSNEKVSIHSRISDTGGG